MKCPLKEDNFGRMPDCQPDCAWMVNGVCAVAARYYDVDANDDLPPENDISAESVGANDANDALDSREKLEADCEKLIGNIQERIFSGRDAGALRCQLKELLNRQAAITEREIEKKWSSFSDSADGHITELSREIGTLRAERDRYRELCGKLLDAADEMRRVRDAFDQFSEVD